MCNTLFITETEVLQMLTTASDGEISRFLYFLQEKIMIMEISGVSELVVKNKVMKYETCKKIYDIVETEMYKRMSLNDFSVDNNTCESLDCKIFLRCFESLENCL